MIDIDILREKLNKEYELRKLKEFWENILEKMNKGNTKTKLILETKTHCGTEIEDINISIFHIREFTKQELEKIKEDRNEIIEYLKKLEF